MSRMIPNNSTTPTIMKLLYFFSYLCARDPVPYPETNSEGIEIHLQTADKTTSAAPKIPNPNQTFASNNNRAVNVDSIPTLPRRSPRHHDPGESSATDKTPSLYFDIAASGNGAYLGCKGWHGSLSTRHTVFAKLWDGWKFSAEHCEYEASIYLQMRDLWGVLVPEFLGYGNWGFCHILLLSYIEVIKILTFFTNIKCPMLHQVDANPTITKNVLNAFKEIHARGIYHGDIRSENILVRPDNSVVVIDFESSEMNADPDLLDAEIEEVKALCVQIQSAWLGGHLHTV